MVNSNEAPTKELQEVIACVSDGIIIYDGYEVLYSNPQGRLLLQQGQQKLLQQLQVADNTSKQQLQLTQNLLAHCLSIHWQGARAHIAIIKQPHDTSIQASQSSHDISDETMRSYFDQLFKSAGDGYWDWHIPTATVFFSRSWLQMLGYTERNLDSSFNTWINLIHPDDLGHFLFIWTEYMDNPSSHFSIEYRVRCHNGEYLWVEAHAIKELNNEGKVIYLAGFHRNIQKRKEDEAKLLEHQQNLESLVQKRTLELEQANLKLLELANKDPLSQLHNRRSFDENLHQQLLMAKRSNYSLCLLLMDIDFFKSFNDAYGHKQGDSCIQAVAEAITSSLLRPGDFAARIGGEEFVAILQDTSLQGAAKVAQRIQHEITQKNLPLNPQTQQTISLSIGMATNLQANESNILELADKAMYAAKENGRNQYCYFSDDLKSVSYIMNNAIL